MSSKLHIRTKCKQQDKLHAEEEEEEENDVVVSPTAHYLNSKTLSVCILAVLEFQVPMDVPRFVPLVQSVFLPINPRFSSIMVVDKEGVRRWKRVKVNIQDHIKIPSFQEGLSIELYDNYFDAYLSQIAHEPFPENMPIWEIHFFKYPTSKAQGHAIFKLHHSLGDGYSLMGALLSCMQRADNPSLPLTFPSVRPKLKVDDKVDNFGFSITSIVKCYVPRSLYAVSAVANAICDFGWSYMKSVWIADDKSAIRSGSEGVGFHPAINISTVEMSLDQLKHIKTKLGVTMNAVLTGIVFFGARLYMQANGTGFSNSKSTALVLLNTRNINGYMSIDEMLKADTKMWGNQFAFLHVALPELTTYSSSKPLDFIFESHKIIVRMKHSPAVGLTNQYLQIVSKCRGPEAAAQFIHSAMKNTSLGFTSMIGPVEQMALLNHPVKGLYFTVAGIHQSLVISATSYMQTLRIGIGAEKGFIDSQKFNSCIQDAFELVYKASTSS